ncbi:guanylate kinase [Buchnera aphidicola]|uniref:guanylate kinase n=1 Tax=Buchnera aphidicola TaxID=9 RepID=UPI003464008B
MKKGTVFIISAPSGAGKSSLIRAVLKSKFLLNIDKSISYTTRTIRPGEYYGKHYYFISVKHFKKMIQENQFLEYARVFGNYYGTSYQIVHKILSKGFDILLDIDWQGAIKIKQMFKNSKSIFILPPSKKELYSRLCKRSQDHRDVIQHRMEKVILEISYYKNYDYLIINDDFDTAVFDLIKIVSSERLSTSIQKYKYYDLIYNLLKKT